MGSEKREDIGSNWSSQEANKLNNMLRWIWYKLHGDINFSDVNPNVKAQMFTYPLQPQGEGNLDASHPFYVRFYVPAEVKKVKAATLNAMVSRYRMDSDVAVSVDSSEVAAVVTGGPSSVSTAYVEKWGNPGTEIGAPRNQVTGEEQIAAMDTLWDSVYPGAYKYDMTMDGSGEPLYVVARSIGYSENPGVEMYYWTDLFKVQHKHNFAHTHEGSASISIPGHGHDLNEGIKESAIQPNNVKIYINDTLVGVAMSEANATQNNIDILTHVVPGQWNVVKITTDNLARITIYGIIELVAQYQNNI